MAQVHLALLGFRVLPVALLELVVLLLAPNRHRQMPWVSRLANQLALQGHSKLDNQYRQARLVRVLPALALNSKAPIARPLSGEPVRTTKLFRSLADMSRMGELEPWIDENFVRSVWYGLGENVNVKMIRDKFSGYTPSSFCLQSAYLLRYC